MRYLDAHQEDNIGPHRCDLDPRQEAAQRGERGAADISGESRGADERTEGRSRRDDEGQCCIGEACPQGISAKGQGRFTRHSDRPAHAREVCRRGPEACCDTGIRESGFKGEGHRQAVGRDGHFVARAAGEEGDHDQARREGHHHEAGSEGPCREGDPCQAGREEATCIAGKGRQGT
jgi:hypothetical protein